MLSTPPAIYRSPSPSRTPRAACPTALSPEAQRRLMVSPGTDTGSPDSSDAIRATLRLSSPDWFAHPMMTSVTREGSRPGCRASSRWMTSAAMSSGRTSLRLPPNEPIGVRTPSMMYASPILDILRLHLALCAVHGPAKQGDDGAVLVADDHAIERQAAADALLGRDRGQDITQRHRRHVRNAVLHTHRHTPVGVRRERQRAIGQRIRDTPVADAEAIEHLAADGRAHGTRRRRQRDDFHAQPRAEPVAHPHGAHEPLRARLRVLRDDLAWQWGHVNRRPSRTIRLSNALGRYRSSPYSCSRAVSLVSTRSRPMSSPQASNPLG